MKPGPRSAQAAERASGKAPKGQHPGSDRPCPHYFRNSKGGYGTKFAR